MRQRDTIIQIIAGVVLVACLAASGVVAMALTASAGRHKLTYVVRAEDNDPPQVGIGIAMGAFRGLFVNILWIRANKLKEEGRYYEAIDLASTITKLQPRFGAVWAFHAWNMAYNISVTTQTPDERWQWVMAGINLLRKEGVVHNPNDLLVHKELGWIHLHKIAGYTDEFNNYYKWRLAQEWTEILGPPPPPRAMDSMEVVVQRWVDWLTPIAEAPDTLDGVIAREPSAAVLIQRLRDDFGAEFDKTFLQRYQRQAILVGSAHRARVVDSFGPRARVMDALLHDESLKAAWDAVLAYTRKRVLINDYNMEPARMVRYTRKYGPMDWRHAATHAVYWVARGVEGALTRVSEANREDFDFINTDRVLIQSIQELFRSGEIYFDYTGSILNPTNRYPTYSATPNVYFVHTYQAVLDELRQRGGIYEDIERRALTVYSSGYENFMKDAIRFYYRRGQRQLAERMKDELGKWEGQNVNDIMRAAYFAKPIDEFILAELEDRLRSPYVAVGEVVAALQAAYVYGLLYGNMQMYRSQSEYARMVHGFYMQKQIREAAINPQRARMEQMPRDFRIVAGDVFMKVIMAMDLDDATRMYRSAPEDLRRYAYDPLVEAYKGYYDRFAQQTGVSFEQAFPEPPGMIEHRRMWQEYLRQMEQRRLDVEMR